MDKRSSITIGIILLVIGGAFAFLIFNPSAREAMHKNANTPIAQTPAPNPNDQSTPTKESKPGAYVDYSETALADAKGTKLIFFHAPWCPQCRSIEADIKQAGVPEGVTILKADYDSSQALRQKYGVTIQTTVVRVDDAGKLVKKYVAYDAPTLDSIKKNLL